MPGYVPFRHLAHPRKFPDWEEFADKTAGHFFDQDENNETFWNLVKRVVIGSEGNVDYLYRDSKGHPTTGFGYLITLINRQTGAYNRAAGERGMAQYRWQINGQVLSRAQVNEQFHRFMSTTAGWGGWQGRGAGQYRNVIPMRLVDANEAWRFKCTREIARRGLSRWGIVTAAMPNWREQPFFIVAAAFRCVWANNEIGNPAGIEKVRNKDWRDYEEDVVTRLANQNLGRNINHGEAHYLRDVCRAGTKYFCASECNGDCRLKNDCAYKQGDRLTPPPRSRTPVPVTRTEPRAAAVPPNYKYDEYRIQLRAWDPFVRTVGHNPIAYPQAGHDAHVSVQGDGHRNYDDVTRSTHRVFVTVKFRYYYEERGGRKIGHYIGVEGLDPRPNAEMRTASAQRQPVFGPTKRYKADNHEGAAWEADATRLPEHDPAGTRVTWAPREQNFESFTIVVNAEDVAAPQVAPRIQGTLRGWFEGNLLKLTLQSTSFPSWGVRVQRTREGAIADMLPEFDTPIVDAFKDFEKYQRDRARQVPTPNPAEPTQPGPPQCDSLTFVQAAAARQNNWTGNIDWTAGPPSANAAATEPTPPPPQPAPANNNQTIAQMYAAQDKGPLYDLLANVWDAERQRFATETNANRGRGFALDQDPGQMNLLAIRGLPFPSLQLKTLHRDDRDRAEYDDTMFVMWIDAQGRKQVRGFPLGTEPTGNMQAHAGGNPTVAWMAPGQAEYIIGWHKKSGTREFPWRQTAANLRNGGRLGTPRGFGYRALIPDPAGGQQPRDWRASFSGGTLRPNTSRTSLNHTLHIHFGGNNRGGHQNSSGSPWSAGCQVIFQATNYIDFIELLHTDTSIKYRDRNTAVGNGPHNRRIVYTLVAENPHLRRPAR